MTFQYPPTDLIGPSPAPTAAQEYSLSDFFIYLMPSHDGRIEFGTAQVLNDVTHHLERNRICACSAKAGVSVARTNLLEKLRAALDSKGISHGTIVKALWVDDDIRILDSARRIADMIIQADSHGWNVIGNYHGLWHNGTYVNVLYKPKSNGAYDSYTDDDIAKLAEYEELPPGTVGGFGFYYGDISLDYKFEFNEYGEDINWFRWAYSNIPNYRLRFSGIRLAHEKKVWL